MVLGKILIFVTLTAAKFTFMDSFEVTTKVKECKPNRVYKKDDVTCICSSGGQWPHQNCSLVFNTKLETICEPDSYVIVNCNICKCSKRGQIDDDLCTKHICGDSQNTLLRRRSSYNNHKCIPNHWYALSSCRFCYCVSKNNLQCSGDIYKQKRVMLDKYDLTDCGTSFLSDVIKLFSVENPSKLGTKIQKERNVVESESEIQAAEIDTNKEVKNAKEDVSSIIFSYNDNRGGEGLRVGKNENKNNDMSDSTENRSGPESAPKDTGGKPIGRIAANTLIPFSKEKDYSDNYSNDLESHSLSRESNEIEIVSENKELELDSSDSKESKIDHDIGVQKNESNPIQDSESFLRVKIPEVLKQVFNFGRKSMLSLEYANCVAGSTVINNCNTCFCLKNGKMLCTKKKCK